jgi:hypothetical protein
MVYRAVIKNHKPPFFEVLGIQIRIGSGFNGVPGTGSGSTMAKMTHKHRKKLINFGYSLLRAEGVSYSLDTSKLQFLMRYIKKFLCFFLLQFSVIKTLDPYPDPDSLEMLDPDPDSMNPDPHLCFFAFRSIPFRC